MSIKQHELGLPPVTHVYVGRDLVRVDELTIEEAREVIIRICDEIEVARRDIYRLRKADAKATHEEMWREIAADHYRRHGGDC